MKPGDAFDSFEFENENEKLKQNQCTNMCDIEGHETDQDRLQYSLEAEESRTSLKREGSTMVDDLVCHDGKGITNVDSIWYMDKSVMEHEQPKLVVYCEENTHHVVKDICVDEKRFDVDIPTSDSLKPSREEKDEEFVDVPDSWPSLEEKLLKDDYFPDCDSIGSVTTGVSDCRTEKTATLEVECSHPDSSTEKSRNNSEEVASSPLISAPERPDENHEEASPASSATIWAAAKSTNLTVVAEESPQTSKVETQGINFNAANFDHESLTRREEAASTRIVSSSQLGESSFSASEPIPFSGSLSERSNSTTSVRSFAFPILQSEWNSSPVRMAKADRQRRNKSWKHALICCKF